VRPRPPWATWTTTATAIDRGLVRLAARGRSPGRLNACPTLCGSDPRPQVALVSADAPLDEQPPQPGEEQAGVPRVADATVRAASHRNAMFQSRHNWRNRKPSTRNNQATVGRYRIKPRVLIAVLSSAGNRRQRIVEEHEGFCQARNHGPRCDPRKPTVGQRGSRSAPDTRPRTDPAGSTDQARPTGGDRAARPLDRRPERSRSSATSSGPRGPQAASAQPHSRAARRQS
jgi:hypothetical protein